MLLSFALLSCTKKTKAKKSHNKLTHAVEKPLIRNSDKDQELQISGDGSIYELKQINFTKDCGKTYETIDAYEV
jgi:hypothetical protein